MFIIKNNSYSIEDLKSAAKILLDKNTLEDWEYHFWLFISEWFNEEKEFIEISTSGSTGKPKLIRHKKEFMVASAKMTCEFFKLNSTKTALLCLPITSVGGMMMIVRSLVSGMNLIVQKPSSNPLFTISRKIDFIAMVPLQVQKSLDESFEKWALIKQVIIGGGKVSHSLEQFLIENKIIAFNTFGMTETISHIAIKRIGVNTIFKGLPSCFFKTNENNCLIIDAKNIGINKLQTNDVVKLISENQFEWIGRFDNAIETGGVKVLPEKIEKIIAPLFSSRFFISSLPDKLLNNKLVLFLEGEKRNVKLSELSSYLSKYEVPKEVYFLNRFEETKTGKFSRKLTVEKFIQNK